MRSTSVLIPFLIFSSPLRTSTSSFGPLGVSASVIGRVNVARGESSLFPQQRRGSELVRKHGDGHDMEEEVSEHQDMEINVDASDDSMEMHHDRPSTSHDHDQLSDAGSHSHHSQSEQSQSSQMQPPSDHDHHAHGVAKEYFNITEWQMTHPPSPLSYFSYDTVLSEDELHTFYTTGLSPNGNFSVEMSMLNQSQLESWQTGQMMEGRGVPELGYVIKGDGRQHGWLMAVHVGSFVLAYFFVLPITLALKAGKFRGLLSCGGKAAFWTLLIFGWVSGVYYKSATPDLYPNNTHNLNGNILLIATIIISSLDILTFFHRIINFVKSDQRDWTTFKSVVINGYSGKDIEGYELFQGTPEIGSDGQERIRLHSVDSNNLGLNLGHALEMQTAQEQKRRRSGSASGPGGRTRRSRTRSGSGSGSGFRSLRGGNRSGPSPWDLDSRVVFELGDDSNDEDSHPLRTRVDSMSNGQIPVNDDQHQLGSISMARDSTSASDSSTLRDSASPSGSDYALDKQLRKHSRTSSTDQPQSFSQPKSLLPPIRMSQSDAAQISASRTLKKRSTAHRLRRIGKYLMHFFERGLVIWAFIVCNMGLLVYVGFGRGWYLPSLLAHFIKGSIFFWYGILSFGRYLGAWAEYGWAWNQRPQHKRHSRMPSAEFIECFVIWLYGITNTWMERIGAAPGSPYTIKQVQHISIAVMFWFAGFSGMALETKVFRDWLAGSIMRKSNDRERQKEPRTYKGSFNPFPALVIGVLGVAMSAHHQDYVFQVTIHSLWGYLLAGFSLFRLLTYFFLYIAPAADSVMPGRPPTEALASLSLAAGGVVFVLSDEEIAWAAMKFSWDDMMAFLNLTIAFVCFSFTWVLMVMTIKGWAAGRSELERQRRRRLSSFSTLVAEPETIEGSLEA